MNRNLVKFVIITSGTLLVSVYFSNQKLHNLQNPAIVRREQTTYWVVFMYNPIATRFISETLSLPIDDGESVAVAANGWGNGKFQTSEKSVYKFTSREEAEKFRQENGGAKLKLTADGLKKYLCLGQTSPPPTDYWVFIFHQRNGEGADFISEVCPLPAYNEELIKNIATWGAGGKAQMIFEKEECEFYKFSSQDDAEKFRQEKGLLNLNLNAKTLKKLICVEQVRRAEANTTPSTDKTVNKPIKKTDD